jgi:branched-chain amino acid transport system substrate-binding protein
VTKAGARWTVTALIAFVLVGFASTGPSEAQNVIKIGLPISTTGALANEARLTADGYKFWAERVNAHGGIDIGGKKYTVQLITYDDQSSVDQSAQLTERLIVQDKVDFLFSPYGSGPVYAASAVSERYRKLMLNGGGTSPSIFTRGFKYFFSGAGTTDFYPKGVFDLVPTLNPRPKTIAVLWKNDLANRSMNARVPEFAKAVGLEVVYNKEFSADATDFATELAVIRSKNPDIVFFLSQLPQFVTAIRQMKAQRLNPKILWNGIAVPQPEFTKTTGNDAEGILGVSFWAPSVKYKDPIWGDTATFVKEFEAKMKYAPDYHVAVAAVGAEMLELAIRKAQTLDTDKVREAVAGLNVETFWGPVHVDETGKNAFQMIIGQIQKGTFTPVYPKAAALAPLVYPKPAWP